MQPDIVSLLFSNLPSWLGFGQVREGTIRGYAAPAGTIWSKGALHITVEPNGLSARARETEVQRLPKWCPELHMNANRTFCLGLSVVEIRDSLTAEQWWADLETHLRLTSVALKTRVWPQHSALDHDVAGRYQSAARKLAKQLHLDEEYARAQLGEASWISDLKGTLVTSSGAPRDAQQLCPCGCTKRNGKPNSFKHCPRHRKVVRLIMLERARRLELQNFWAEAWLAGARCCGKMRDCPLAAGAPESPPDHMISATRNAAFRYLV